MFLYHTRFVILILSLITASICMTSCTERKDPVKENYVLPIDSAQAESELRSLNERISKNPSDASLYYKRAQIFLKRNVLQTAFNDAVMATTIDSTRPEYFLLLGDISFRGLQVPKSVKAYESCLKLDPKNIEANLKLAEIYFYLKAYTKSVTYSNEVLKLDQRMAKPYFLKGFVYKESGDTVRAISSFQTVTELEPENYDAHHQLGIIHAAKGDKLALQYYNNALKVRPNSTEALYNRGLFFQEHSDFDKAIADYQSILKIDPSYTDAYYNQGFIALVNRKDYKTAIDFFSKVVQIDQNYIEAFYNRGLAHEYAGNKSAAREDYNKALSIFPNYSLAKEGLERIR
ncbi:MAG: tetratricopeptide repeat protein [Bacteroidetes bacterium]|nr:MAG: tetratricopeptide repeat protein [Bacteroidota bacterium]REJ99736.1 MAG: tetratricopeptide repeat protein [Bacteroidota bacterium]REK32930.1 MAG: tetratricopeptide repeat protein [Bacteroidota bacterium]REK47735.1 MAG: tetratricopeptide repeat protein [Bacteroidota bacterium]